VERGVRFEPVVQVRVFPQQQDELLKKSNVILRQGPML
jgi:hypothetical protein